MLYLVQIKYNTIFLVMCGGGGSIMIKILFSSGWTGKNGQSEIQANCWGEPGVTADFHFNRVGATPDFTCLSQFPINYQVCILFGWNETNKPAATPGFCSWSLKNTESSVKIYFSQWNFIVCKWVFAFSQTLNCCKITMCSTVLMLSSS